MLFLYYEVYLDIFLFGTSKLNFHLQIYTLENIEKSIFLNIFY